MADDLYARFAQGLKQVKAVNADLVTQAPGVATGLAGSEDPTGNAAALTGFIDGQTLMAGMQGLTPEEEALTYGRMSVPQQTALLGQGYTPSQQTIEAGQKAAAKKGGGFSLWHVIGDVLGAGKWAVKSSLNALGNIGTHTIGYIPGTRQVWRHGMTSLNAGLAFIQHLERFGVVAGKSVVDPDALKNMYTPEGNLYGKGIGDLWHLTQDGDKLINPGGFSILQNKGMQTPLADEYKPIAMDAAFGMKQDELAAKYGDVGLVNRAVNDPNFESYVNELNDSKISLGRMAANMLGYHPHDATGGHLFHATSAAVDAVNDTALDPVMLAGGAIKSLRANMNVIRGADGVDGLYQASGQFRATVDHIPSYVKDGEFDAGRFAHENPTLKPLTQHFTDAAKAGNLAHPEDAIDVMKKALEPLNRSLGEASGVGLPNASTIAQIKPAVGVLGGKWATKVGVGKLIPFEQLFDLKQGAKYAVEDAVDKAKSWMVPGTKYAPLKRAATMVQRLATMTPSRELLDKGLNPNGKNFLNYAEQMAKMGTRSPAEVREFVTRLANADGVAKANTYASLLQDTLEANARMLGTTVAENPFLARQSARVKGFMDTIQEATDLAGEAPSIEINGVEQSLGDGGLEKLNSAERDWGSQTLGTETLSGKLELGNYPILDYRELARATHAMNILHTKHLVDFSRMADNVDALMEQVWKPMNTFMKVSFGLRVAGEEAFLNIMRHGLLSTAKGEMAVLNQRAERGIDSVLARRAKAAEKGATGLGEGAKALRDHIAQTTWTGVQKMSGKLAGQEYMDAATMLVKHMGEHYVPRGLDAEHAVMSQTDRALVNSIRGKIPTAKEAEALKLRNVPGYKETNWPSLSAWHSDLVMTAKGPEYAKVAPIINSWKGTRTALEKKVSKELEAMYRTPEYLEQYSHNPGLFYNPDFEVTVKRMADTNARRITDKLVGADGKPLKYLTNHLTKYGVPPDIEDLASNIARENMPRFIQEHYQRAPGRWDTVTHWAADHQSKVIGGFARRPIFVDAYAKELKALEPQMSQWSRDLGADVAEDVWHERAFMNAWENTSDFVHNPELRSQFAEMHRNTIPFWFAHQQFLQRWGKAILDDPTIIRKAQLTMHGLRSVGWVHHDENGDYFTYPGTKIMREAIAPVARTVFGADLGDSMVGQFDGRINALSPGLGELGEGVMGLVPSPGPLMTIPLAAAARRFPELQGVLKVMDPYAASGEKDPVTGKIKGNKPIWRMVLPSWMGNMMDAKTPDENSTQFLSAYRDQIMSEQSKPTVTNKKTGEYVSGALPEGATAIQKQEFQDRARQRARGVLMLRAMTGFISPAGTPTYKYTNKLSDEFKTLIRETNDIHQATEIFLQSHPNATPADFLKNSAAMVFESQLAAKGTYIPPTKAAGDFIRGNMDFIKQYGAAATYFLPWDKNGQFDQGAYNDELSSQLRVKRDAMQDQGDVTSLVNESYISKDAEPYYNMQRMYNALLDQFQGVNPKAVTQLNMGWSKWKAEYLATRPVFDQYVRESQARAGERAQTLNSLRAAVNDPNRPMTDHDAAIQDVIAKYDAYQQVHQAIFGRRDAQAAAIRKQVRDGLEQYAGALTDPIAKMVYSSLIESQI